MTKILSEIKYFINDAFRSSGGPLNYFKQAGWWLPVVIAGMAFFYPRELKKQKIFDSERVISTYENQKNIESLIKECYEKKESIKKIEPEQKGGYAFSLKCNLIEQKQISLGKEEKE